MDLNYIIKFGLTASLVIIYIFSFKLSQNLIESFATKRGIREKRTIYTKKFINALFILVLLAALIFTWGIDIKGIFIFASSFLAFVGIALFASWSILSNITASIIMFFSFPYKIGDKIRVVDSENSLEGVIKDMTFFNLCLESKSGDTIYYPNNLAIQKPIIKLQPREQKKRRAGR